MSRKDTDVRLKALQASVERMSERIADILIVKEPGTTYAAEAYEGLRRTVVSMDKTRQQHLAHLARIDSALSRGESREALSMLLRELMAETGLQRLDTFGESVQAFFEVVGNGYGEPEVVQAAYVDPIDDGRARPILTGVARFVDGAGTEAMPDRLHSGTEGER